MEPEFEFLPFQAEGESLEQERGRAAPRRSAPVRSVYRAPPRSVYKAPARKWPGLAYQPRFPAAGGWPYAPVVVDPWPTYVLGPVPRIEPEPEPEPGPDGDAPQEPGQDEFGWRGEVPATLRATQRRLSGALPNYVAMGPLDQALDPGRPQQLTPDSFNGPGLYLIEFTDHLGQRRAYSGQSQNVRRRLLQHKLCATMLGFDVSKHRVSVAPLAAPDPRRQIELNIHRDMSTNRKGVLTNQRREFEAELLGAGWR